MPSGAYLVVDGGSPPRVRSRRRRGDRVDATAVDHLRVCGADSKCLIRRPTRSGSPPRVRSRRAAGLFGACLHGITSACAEQTKAGVLRGWTLEDHLRVCGADLSGMGF